MGRSSHTWRPAFLAAIRQVPVMAHGVRAVGIDRSWIVRCLQEDPEFKEQYEDALQEGIDRAEQEAFRRGVEGFYEPVIHQGRLQYAYERYLDEAGEEKWRMVLDKDGQPVPLTTRKHSDALLAMYLKGRRKEVYAERTEITGADGGAVKMDDTTRAARIAALLDAAKRRKELDDIA